MLTPSVQQVINGLLDRKKDFPAEEEKKKRKAKFAEEDAYAALDPVLNELHKSYLKAKAQHKYLVDLRGEDDPMTEVAFDQLDSAKSAKETRLIELKTQNEIKLRAQELMKETHEEIEEERKEKSRLYKKRLLDFDLDLLRMVKEAEEEDQDDILLMMVALLLLQTIMNKTKVALSLANTFSTVSEHSNRESYA